MKLKQYKFEWYKNSIIHISKKNFEAKEGKIVKDYFINMIQKKEFTEIEYGTSGIDSWKENVDYLSDWFLSFFAYHGEKRYDRKIWEIWVKYIRVKKIFKHWNQMLIVSFKKFIIKFHKKEYLIKYKFGFKLKNMSKLIKMKYFLLKDGLFLQVFKIKEKAYYKLTK